MRATILEKALEKSFRLTGGTAHVSTKDDLARLFSGRLNTKDSAERKKLAMEYLNLFNTIPRGQIRTAELDVT